MTLTRIKKAFILVTMAFLTLVILTVTANASSKYLTKLAKNQYLETRRTIHTTNSHYKNVKITIPKGTVFKSGSLGKSAKSHKTYITINMNNLSWHLRKGIVQSKHNVTVTKGIWAKTSYFKKVHAPKYQSYFKQPYTGNLGGLVWQGNKSFPLRQQFKIENCFRVTEDGYLEYFTGYNYWVTKMPRPYSYAKIHKTIKKGSSLYVYTKSKVCGFPMYHVHKKGNDRYRLKIRKTNQHLATINPDQNKKYDDSVTISIRYYVGGKKFYVNSQRIYP
ncbi:hypothetical protein [Lentilactobacillus kefiri]|uniref:Surface layer protein A domain-containing protein n=2 Tax=Lentilactobacillus kefiri TaxID=33962 RepID=A0A8E1RN40_LENKE|nr:hypothetical protein [Lentilactobacillus kefiri]KRL70124.1 hypothetical protein FD08_GL001358 [Lentilactobacillus parakefiri DSM 10551]KRM54086.1 hypothetical protein FC95_GL001791 [Lentilactobacillus kefiri DSM 20587 = JCM 5818]MCJ2160936.1 hypothetical protein [Lentilactobacillus kefiri]MDM7492977.1 hypothetical protein [Lentilactobacillus kefiri]PAK59081.1 hypothetical protein B9K02_08105 [Lentilactobacillus kefiri]